jgi:DNA repair exonuclease SbcCD nuclease subunit
MKLLIVSDHHLGLSRKAHSTTESSKKREELAWQTLEQALETPHELAICCGDFFDKPSNSETLIAKAIPVAQAFEYILYCNHDVYNNTELKSSLDLVSHITSAGVREPYSNYVDDNTGLYLVPHALSQGLFLENLAAMEDRAISEGFDYRLLFLHCNYDAPFEVNEQTLNLTEERTKLLLETFTHIFIGHEHTPRTLFDRRLFVVGSHFPTAFDNLDDKRALVFDTADGSVTEHTLWRRAPNVYEGPVALAPLGRQFYSLEIESDSAEAQRLAVKLFKEGALGVRLLRRESHEELAKFELRSIEHLPEKIGAELQSKDPELFALWQELTNA